MGVRRVDRPNTHMRPMDVGLTTVGCMNKINKPET